MGSWLRTAGVWLGLVVVFTTFYLLSGRQREPQPLIAWLPYLLPLLFLDFFAFFFRRQRRAASEAMAGVAQLTRGSYSQALATFDRTMPRLPRSNALPFNRGLALLALWRVAEADQAFARAAALKGLGNADLTLLLVPLRALASALLGRTDAARAHLAEADRLDPSPSPQHTLARLVLAARTGAWEQVQALSQRFELTQLGGVGRGLTDALRAWTAEQLEGRRPALDATPLLGETGVAAVRATWPELADFVERATAPPGR